MSGKQFQIIDAIKLLDSSTIKALLVATVPLLALIATMFGIDNAIFDAQAGVWTERILAFVTAGGIAWAAWSRIFKPTPPLTEIAREATAVMLADEDLTTSPVLGGGK